MAKKNFKIFFNPKNERTVVLRSFFARFVSIICQDDMRKRMNFTRMIWRKGWSHPILQIVLVENSQRGKELKTFCPLNSIDDLCLVFCIYSFYMVILQYSTYVLLAWIPHQFSITRGMFLWLSPRHSSQTCLTHLRRYSTIQSTVQFT